MPTVSPEHLVDVVIAADAERRRALGQTPARYRPWQRIWVEPFFNILGIAIGQALLLLPWPLRKRADLWVIQKMQGHPAEANPRLLSIAADTVHLAQQLKTETGQWPAMLIFTSHPETTGSLEWLRFELLRQGMVVADAVLEAKKPGAFFHPHPECFLAIDPFALDTISAAVGGIYSAWMHRIYLAWDRQASTQSWIQRHLFLRNSGYTRIIWRVLRRLRSDVPVLMILSGGLPFNARLLYTAREFVQRLKPVRWPVPKRAAEKKFMEILMQPVGGERPSEEGKLPEETDRALRRFLGELGLSQAEQDSTLALFKDEFRREVPYRQRLFSVLVGRLVKRGKPLLLLGISHANQPPYARVSAPWALYQERAGGLRVARGSLEQSQSVADIATVAKDFAVANFANIVAPL